MPDLRPALRPAYKQAKALIALQEGFVEVLEFPGADNTAPETPGRKDFIYPALEQRRERR